VTRAAKMGHPDVILVLQILSCRSWSRSVVISGFSEKRAEFSWPVVSFFALRLGLLSVVPLRRDWIVERR